ncbi:MAG: peptidoglycan-binding protein [Cyanobacteria bacterium P01_C01_bin.70]
MVNRVLLIALTSVATCGLGPGAIARAQSVDAAQYANQEILVSQRDNDDSPGTQQASPAIEALQNRLSELGYYNGEIDGIFGTETRDALAAFQRDSGLVGTGILDPLTQERLANPDGGAAEAGEIPETDAPGAPATANDGDSPLSDLPPVNEDGEVQPGADVPAPEGTPTVGAEGEAAAEPSPEGEMPTATPDPAESTGVGRLVLLGLAIVVLGALGAGTVLWLAKRGQPKAVQGGSNNREPANPANDAIQTPHSAPMAPPPPPPSQPTAAAPSQNGIPRPTPPKPSKLTPEPQSALDVRHQFAAITNPAEPRVAKINIIDELIHDLEQPNAEQRRKAIWELGQRGNSAAVQPLVDLLEQSDSREQSLILAALAEIGIKTLKPINRGLVIALKSENAEVRKNAIRDLTRIYGSLNQAGRSLGHTSAIDDDPEVRQTANWALDQLNKMRLNANDSAGRLKGSATPQGKKKMPEDDSSSS